MVVKKFQPLNMNKLNKKESVFISSQQSLKDIMPIKWSQDVIKEKRKIIVTNSK